VPTERTVLVRLKADVGSFQRGMAEAAAGVGALRKEINTTNDRTAWLTQGILALAPAAVTLGAGAVPAIAGVTTQMGVAAAAAGVLALGFHGVGDALKALNDYQLDPTDAHLKKLNITMQKIGPAGAEFVHFLDSLGPVLNELSNTARAGMFPGIEDGITSLMRLAPEVKRVVAEIADGIGQLASEGGKNLAGPKFREFFKWLESDAKPILLDMGRTVGNVFEGLVNLFLAFTGESARFSKGLLDMSRSFAEWSRTLDTNQSFQNFLDYVDKSGPQALAFLGQLIQSLAAFVAAAAPVGSVMLPALTELLKIFAQVASTPLGSTLIALGAAMSVYGRSVAIGTNLTSGLETRFGMVNAQAHQDRVLVPRDDTRDRDVGPRPLPASAVRPPSSVSRHRAWPTSSISETLLLWRWPVRSPARGVQRSVAASGCSWISPAPTTTVPRRPRTSLRP
jgi:hypothetical protein